MKNKQKRRTRESVAVGLISAVQVVREIVKQFATGDLRPSVTQATRSNTRIAPHFSRRVDLSTPGVRYSIKNVTDVIATRYGRDVTAHNGIADGKIQRTANLYIRVALLLLEAFEEGWADERTMLDGISRRLPGYNLNLLLRKLRAERKAALREEHQTARNLLRAAAGK